MYRDTAHHQHPAALQEGGGAGDPRRRARERDEGQVAREGQEGRGAAMDERHAVIKGETMRNETSCPTSTNSKAEDMRKASTASAILRASKSTLFNCPKPRYTSVALQPALAFDSATGAVEYSGLNNWYLVQSKLIIPSAGLRISDPRWHERVLESEQIFKWAWSWRSVRSARGSNCSVLSAAVEDYSSFSSDLLFDIYTHVSTSAVKQHLRHY
ncbi:hypothetical protein K438DRAFT_1779312 [Mycena galopus ATCC 62051]|nr:hypothetical protein K438DRAFT_1779312 [Mycena galopus ATCC 62051]